MLEGVGGLKVNRNWIKHKILNFFPPLQSQSLALFSLSIYKKSRDKITPNNKLREWNFVAILQISREMPLKHEHWRGFFWFLFTQNSVYIANINVNFISFLFQIFLYIFCCWRHRAQPPLLYFTSLYGFALLIINYGNETWENSTFFSGELTAKWFDSCWSFWN